MKTPPLLLGATLVFWGWQSGFLEVGALMAIVLEGSRVFKTRWDFTDQDFTRIWTFCSLLLLASLVYAFSANKGPSDFSEFFQNPSFITQRNAGTASARTAAATMRWLPMIFFLFIAAQAYSGRAGIPLETVSLILRRRWKKARRLGLPPPASKPVDVSYLYFALCLFAASIHASEDGTFFWGLCALVAWALCVERARRFRLAVWAGALAAAVALGYFGQQGFGRLQHYFDSFNPQWFSSGSGRFDATQNRTELGRIGRLKASGQIVLRLEAKTGYPPPLLREASYLAYEGQTWTARFPEKDWTDIHSTEPNGSTYLLVPGKTNFSTLNIACYLPGGKALLPLPAGCARLDNLLAIFLRRSPMGAVLDEGPGLVVFDASYGPGATIDAPPGTNDDLAVPDREVNALDQVIAQAHLRGLSQPHTLRALSTLFADKFTYSTWQPGERHRGTNSTALSRFLLRTHAGHCEYFASAGVLLLRRLGIPARYAVGYAVHEGVGSKYVVRLRDAHAWCLVWDERAGIWRDFDPTPGVWVAAESERASPLQWLSDFWSRVLFEFSRFRWGQSNLRQYLLWGVAPVLAILLYQIVFRRRGSRRRLAAADAGFTWPGLDSEFYQFERKLAQRGFARPPGEPLSEWLRRAAETAPLADLQSTLQDLLRLHYRYRFDPQGLSAAEREALRRQARLCLARLSPATRSG